MGGSESAKADLILYNAKVITLDEERPFAEIVAIKGNKILAIGTKNDRGIFEGSGTALIDCEGGTVVPGFNDAHCHPISFAISLLSVDCSERSVKNIYEIQDRIRQRAKNHPEGAWIRASNFDECNLEEKRFPTRWELDEASPLNPVILIHRTAGKCILNSIALRLSSITRDNPDTSNDSVDKDPETGEPSGLIIGRNERLEKILPPITLEELENGMKLANKEYLSRGITSLQDTTWRNGLRNWQIWQRLVNEEIISPRISMFLNSDSIEQFKDILTSKENRGERLRIGGVKIALDESTGCLHPAQEDINRVAKRVFDSGLQMAFHVSDLYMLEASLNAINYISDGSPEEKYRFRLEHCAICTPGSMQKIKKSQAVVVTQPSFLHYLGQAYQSRLASDQRHWFQPIGSFLRSHINIAFSSDSPMIPCDPLTGIYSAVTRKTESGQKIAPEESISLIEALKMYTLGGAYASFEEKIKGSISEGKLADIVVLDGELNHSSPEQLLELKVKICMIAGKILWQK